MFSLEAAGLQWLGESGVRTPNILFHGTSPVPHLVLEWIQSGTTLVPEKLGRSLAQLHSFTADSFGWRTDNYIGTLTQRNDDAPSWSQFYWESRLRPMLRLLDIPSTDFKVFEKLGEDLPNLIPEEPPVRLHGDLWAGNILADSQGSAVFIDPAVYGGNREIDLAMLALFGSIPQEMLASYQEVRPLAPGFRERLPLHQLYPLLVHGVLFGGSYYQQAKRIAQRFVS